MFTVFFSRTLLVGATSDDKHDAEYAFIISPEHARFNADYGTFLQKNSKMRTEKLKLNYIHRET